MASSRRDLPWLLNHICTDKRSSSENKCRVNISDFVLLDPSTGVPRRWLFTSKGGGVSKKKDDNITLENIRERFCKVALGSSQGGGASVSVYSARTSTPYPQPCYLLPILLDRTVLYTTTRCPTHTPEALVGPRRVRSPAPPARSAHPLRSTCSAHPLRFTRSSGYS